VYQAIGTPAVAYPLVPVINRGPPAHAVAVANTHASASIPPRPAPPR
jgi:hypothetical protein